MKIIGSTGDGYILQAEEREVARLIGFYSGCDCRDRLKVGTEIKVNEMFDQLYKIRSIKSQTKAIEVAASELLECIRTKSPIIDPIQAAIESASPK